MIGILGGTFDPIHNGHLHIATQVFTRLDLESVQFVPCALPVHRDRPHATAAHRGAMIKLAIAEQAAFTLNTLELERSGLSYTVDSLHQIRLQTDAVLVFVLGADAFNGFGNWKLPDDILCLAHLVVCYRPGFEVDQALYYERRVDSPQELSRQSAGAILMLEVDAIDCSSSVLRVALEARTGSGKYLAPTVATYIDKHNLYCKPGG